VIAEFAEGKAEVQHTAGGDKSVEDRRLAMEEKKILLEKKRLGRQRMQMEQQKMQLEEQKLQRKEQRLQREQQQEQIKMQLENRKCSESWRRDVSSSGKNNAGRESLKRENGKRKELISIVQL